MRQCGGAGRFPYAGKGLAEVWGCRVAVSPPCAGRAPCPAERGVFIYYLCRVGALPGRGGQGEQEWGMKWGGNGAGGGPQRGSAGTPQLCFCPQTGRWQSPCRARWPWEGRWDRNGAVCVSPRDGGVPGVHGAGEHPHPLVPVRTKHCLQVFSSKFPCSHPGRAPSGVWFLLPGPRVWGGGREEGGALGRAGAALSLTAF